MIRAFMRVTFSKLIDILFVLGFAVTFIGAWMSASAMGGFSLLAFIVALLSGTAGLVLLFGLVYLLLDIRDGFQEKKRHLSSFRLKKRTEENDERTPAKAPEPQEPSAPFTITIQPGVIIEKSMAKTKELLDSSKQKVLPHITAWREQVRAALHEQRERKRAADEKKKAEAAAKADALAKAADEAKPAPGPVAAQAESIQTGTAAATVKVEAVPESMQHDTASAVYEPAEPAAAVSEPEPVTLESVQTEEENSSSFSAFLGYEPAPVAASVPVPETFAAALPEPEARSESFFADGPEQPASAIPAPDSGAAATGALPERRPAGKLKIVLAAVALLLVIAAAGAAYVLMGTKDESQAKSSAIATIQAPKAAPQAAPAAPAPGAGLEKEPAAEPAPAEAAPEKPAAGREPAPAAAQKKQQAAQPKRPPAKKSPASTPAPAEKKPPPKEEKPKNVLSDIFRRIPKGKQRETSVYD